MNIDKELQESSDWEKIYVDKIYELLDGDRTLYEAMALELFANGIVLVTFNDIPAVFRLTRVGCSYLLGALGGQQRGSGWVRLGWRKSSKYKSLHFYFAQVEASAWVDENY